MAISDKNKPVWGKVTVEMKERIHRIRSLDQTWSESRLIEEGLERIVPEVEQKLPPNHERPRRKKKTTA